MHARSFIAASKEHNIIIEKRKSEKGMRIFRNKVMTERLKNNYYIILVLMGKKRNWNKLIIIIVPTPLK